MTIPDDRLDNFIHIYKEEFGEDISLEEAREMLMRLVTLYQLLSRPLPNGDRHQDVGDLGDVPRDAKLPSTDPDPDAGRVAS